MKICFYLLTKLNSKINQSQLCTIIHINGCFIETNVVVVN